MAAPMPTDDMADLRLQMNEVRKIFDHFVAETRAKAAAEQAAHAAAMTENKGAQLADMDAWSANAHRFRHSSLGACVCREPSQGAGSLYAGQAGRELGGCPYVGDGPCQFPLLLPRTQPIGL